ncbi:MAG TPA: hypothetical protein VK253_06700 [Candidatus Binatia bacterium]|nr:hypothetical protein [Candidatus Binatia bacterium]
MVDSIFTGILTWFHVVSVIGWSGAAITFLVAIGPSLKKLSPQANSEILLKLFPRYVRTIQTFTVLTIIFGPLLAFTMNLTNEVGGPNSFDLISPWSRLITAGASVGIFSFFLVFFAFTPTAKGLGLLIQQMQQNPQQPPPKKFGTLQKRAAILGPLAVTLLLTAEVFMVTAAQF